MLKSINARIQGDIYQELFFWFCALDMFYPETNVEKVAYECDYAKSFDDVVVYYKEDKPRLDRWLNPVLVDFYQVKFHVTDDDAITSHGLMDPNFIRAKTSIMERLRDAQRKCSENEIQARFNFVTPYHIHPDDNLSKIVSNYEYEIRIDKLFDGKKRSNMAKLRNEMITHLNISTDEELMEIINPFRIWHGFVSIELLKQVINSKLLAYGFKLIENDSILNQYVELIQRWSLGEITEFTKDFIIKECEREELYFGTNPLNSDYDDVGIVSFLFGAENIREETAEICCLLEFFDGRLIKEQYSWNEDIFKKLDEFRKKLSLKNKYRLHLDTHSSIAFVAGQLFSSKSGIEIYPMQKSTNEKEFWYPGEGNRENYIGWVVNEKVVCEEIKDVALVLEVVHPILKDVEGYIETNGIEISKIITCSVGADQRPDVIIDGMHAKELSISLSTVLKDRRDVQEKRNNLHIFASCPAGLMFYLGKLSRSFGKIILYEHDFEGLTEKMYFKSFELPIELGY